MVRMLVSYLILIVLVTRFPIHSLPIVDRATNTDVLKNLQALGITCNLKEFIKSTENPDQDYHYLIAGLTNYCSSSESTQRYFAVCRVAFTILRIACLLNEKTRPSPVPYSISSRPLSCAYRKSIESSAWIWEKLDENDQKKIGASSSDLCRVLNVFNDTYSLAKFLLKLGFQLKLNEIRMHNVQFDGLLNDANLNRTLKSENIILTREMLVSSPISTVIVLFISFRKSSRITG